MKKPKQNTQKYGSAFVINESVASTTNILNARGQLTIAKIKKNNNNNSANIQPS